ncbi:Dehydroquinase [Tilletiaria anomala UBC 951]|uniref:Catabolic 3-dehydroquinase n=1 Tax=Tilletiaria anomala (strain ATCC 24038 / CBS 436.72 / UBC 951) TaxID=1037660 RepID=A0A066VTA8_TILAU|nr:Dehydroquinase [Tilletiaria anomala UBC 951]KDN44942.1 Dehydroquinase [Tilletiaria anomala UBC 951]
MAKSILLLNGPNLNMLGLREPDKYGTATLGDIVNLAGAHCLDAGVAFDHLQTNHEGTMLDRIHQARSDGTQAIVINAGAWTHTSVALRDALLASEKPFIELHISNTHAREPFRHHSYLADKAKGIIMGLGTYGYTVAIDYCIKHLM